VTQVDESKFDEAEFAARTEPFRRELLAHCYRMLGSVDDAEDVVQETYLRAWRAFRDFEGRSSVRTWLHRIATNTCLTALTHRSRRVLPSGLGPPAEDPHTTPEPAGPGVVWLQPIPDALVRPEAGDPAAVAESRADLRLALVASLQYLPPRQRAVLLLRDVLGFSAAEVAATLDTTTHGVKSALARARTRLAEVSPTPDAVLEPDDAGARRQLERYIAAFEASDAAALERLLRDDAVIETDARTWYAGKSVCVPFLRAYAVGSPGDWRMLPTRANGQPAAVAYVRGADGAHRAWGVAVLTTTAGGLARITVFTGAGLARRFGAPERL
jgi:RNA polymerase sigma-70 factor, ECF subfamily